jgi:GTPase
VIVVDVSDHEHETHLRTTLELISKLGAADVARFYVFNKADRLASPPDPEELTRLSNGRPWALVSSSDADAVGRLEAKLLDAVRPESEVMTAFVPYAASQALSLIYAHCRVLGSDASDTGLTLRFQGPASVVSRLASQGVNV